MEQTFLPRTPSRPAVPNRLAVVGRAAEEALVVTAAALCYFLVRGLVDGREALAFAHSSDLIALERRLGVFWEPTLQGWVLARPPLPTVFNWIYIWGHWPVVAGTLLWLYFFHRAAFPRYRNALLVSGAIGLVVFATYPVAPPRLVEGWGFVDTVTLHSNAYRVLQPPSLTNQFAAMPSLHFGWNLLMGIAVVRHASRPVAKLFGVLMPLAMLCAVVLTANHFVLDAAAGGGLALVGLVAAQALGRAKTQQPARGSRAARSRTLLRQGRRRSRDSLHSSPSTMASMRPPVGHPERVVLPPYSPAITTSVANSDAPLARAPRTCRRGRRPTQRAAA